MKDFFVDVVIVPWQSRGMKNITPTNDSVRDEVRAFLEKEGMSSHGLAVRACVPPSGLHRFIEGRAGISLETYGKIARAMKEIAKRENSKD